MGRVGVPEGSFDLVPIKVTYEATVVGRAIVRARSRCAIGFAASSQGGTIERIHCHSVRGDKSEVGAIADAGRLSIDRTLYPELRVFAAPGYCTGVGHDALAAKSSEHLVVERYRFVEAISANRNVGQDAGVLFTHLTHP